MFLYIVTNSGPFKGVYEVSEVSLAGHVSGIILHYQRRAIHMWEDHQAMS